MIAADEFKFILAVLKDVKIIDLTDPGEFTKP